jgi:hypothetical protein
MPEIVSRVQAEGPQYQIPDTHKQFRKDITYEGRAKILKVGKAFSFVASIARL